MKRTILCCLLVMVLFICSGLAYAEDLDEPIDDPDVPEYTEASVVSTWLMIKSGEAICKTDVSVANSSSANKMTVTVKYIKNSVGTVATKNATAYRSGISFTAKTKYALPSSGTYHCKVTIKLYNGSTLLETITVLTNSVTY